MDQKDRQIVAALQDNGRLTNQELSERVNLSPSPCLRRLRNLEESGIVKGYTAIVDEAAYGLPLTAFVRIRLERHTEETVKTFERKIRDTDNVVDCYMMTGGSDYLLRVLVESLEDYEQFVRSRLHLIEGIAAIETSFAYGTVKRASRFPRVRERA
ncbi:MAG: Lrp/AsnC family transcriptional regulator [Rhizobiaceae bacterium]